MSLLGDVASELFAFLFCEELEYSTHYWILKELFLVFES